MFLLTDSGGRISANPSKGSSRDYRKAMAVDAYDGNIDALFIMAGCWCASFRALSKRSAVALSRVLKLSEWHRHRIGGFKDAQTDRAGDGGREDR